MDHLENKRLTTEQVIERHGLWLRGRTGGLRADFRGGELAEVYLKGVNLRKADLSEANLQRAVLADSVLSGADLSEANLRKADLNGADMTGANFKGANFERITNPQPMLWKK